MIALYLTSNNNLHLIDSACDNAGITIKKLVGSFNLAQFIRSDLRNYTQASYIILDRAAIKENDEELLSCMQSLQLISSARVILFADGYSPQDPFLSQLVDVGITNIVIGSYLENIDEDFAECISPAGLSKEKYQLLGKELDKEQAIIQASWECNSMRITVAGTMDRMGTTTLAIQLASYFASNKASVACTNMTGQRIDLFARMAKWFPVIETDFGFTYRNIDFYYKGQAVKTLYNIIIDDMGTLSADKLKDYATSDIRLLCAGSRFDEFPALAGAIKLVEDMNIQIVGVFTPTTSTARTEMQDFVGQYGLNISFANFAPDMFSAEENKELFEDVAMIAMESVGEAVEFR